MEIKQKEIVVKGIKFSIEQNNKEIGRAYLYLMTNDLHNSPFGLMEDVYIEEEFRGQGLGKELVQKIIAVAKGKGCYKLLSTSRHTRPKVHILYEKLGFNHWGKEFRMDF